MRKHEFAESLVFEHVRQAALLRAKAIEYACEAALLTGTMGVLVKNEGITGEPNGALTYSITAMPDPSVPYGRIHFTP